MNCSFLNYWFWISYHRGTGAADGRDSHADVRDEFRFHLRHVVRQHGQPHGFELRERQFSRQRRFRQLRHGLSVGYVHACGNQSGGADVVLINPDEEWTVDAGKLHGKSKNTPFKGRTLTGKVKKTILGGKVVFED